MEKIKHNFLLKERDGIHIISDNNRATFSLEEVRESICIKVQRSLDSISFGMCNGCDINPNCITRFTNHYAE